MLPALHTFQHKIYDRHGRMVILRGVNLGGDCKVPYPDGGTQHPTDFADHRNVSFIGRPFPLSEAHEHLQRLRHWGFNCLRLLTTWEAIEHSGPAEYDQAYLDYYTEVCRLAGEHDFYVFVDFHQDVWSRMSGGDGAPGWIFDVVGMDLTKLDAADAAITMQRRYDYQDPRGEQPENYARMCWSQNYRYPANAIMWSLFFAGREITPDFQLTLEPQLHDVARDMDPTLENTNFNKVNIQDYLQCHYLGCLHEVARRVQDQTHVMGFDSLNEPSRGWIGLDINDNRTADKAERMPGPAIAPIDGLLMAQGRTVTVPEVKLSYLRLGLVPSGTRVLNANRVTIWHSSERDPFLQRGAYSLEADGSYRVHMPALFQKKSDGSPLDFDSDCMRVLFERVARVMRMHNKDWMLFAEKEPHATLLNPELPPAPEQTVNAGHWYDVTVLFLKKFPYPFGFDGISGKPALGANGIRKSYIRQLGAFQQASVKQQQPALLGEFGIPFDLDNGRAYKAAAHKQKDGSAWRKHSLALGLMYDAIDHHLLHSTLWNYTASNRNDARIGDGWNQEDLSIYSADQKHGVFGSNAGVSFHPDNGGRALSGFVRPYVRRAQGTLLSMQYDSKKRTFEVEIAVRTNTDGHPTEIFVPAQVYKNSYRYQVWLPVGYAYTAVCRSLSLQPHDVEALLLIYVTTDGKHGAATTDTDDAIDADDQHATDRRMQILIRPEK